MSLCFSLPAPASAHTASITVLAKGSVVLWWWWSFASHSHGTFLKLPPAIQLKLCLHLLFHGRSYYILTSCTASSSSSSSPYFLLYILAYLSPRYPYCGFCKCTLSLSLWSLESSKQPTSWPTPPIISYLHVYSLTLRSRNLTCILTYIHFHCLVFIYLS